MTDDAMKREADDKKAREDAEKREAKNRKDVAGDDADIQHFETTIAKIVPRKDEDGKEWEEEVMSDNLFPGERLKRDDDEQEKERKDDLARARASVVSDERRKSDDEALQRHQAAEKRASTNKSPFGNQAK